MKPFLARDQSRDQLSGRQRGNHSRHVHICKEAKENNMNIIGPDTLIFGVDDVAACVKYLIDYGLEPIDVSDAGGRFEALDGTGLVIRHKDDPSLPPPLETSSMLRKTVYGVADHSTIEEIAAELSKDRQVQRLADGTIELKDDHGFVLGFQVTARRMLSIPPEKINAPGSPAQRAVNQIGVWQDMPARPRTLSHVVLFVPDLVIAVAFYVERLGFRVTDTLTNAGPFLRPAGNPDHHTLFFLQTPIFMKGCEHLAFHLGGPTELMLAGSRFVEAGYQSFWGPGRHKFGSNWFWYFNSPLGCHIEYDADMDTHDETWVAREMPMGPENSQAFLLAYREKWAPGGPPGPGRSGPPA
jgi:catechol 2,3-dioxygenase-like lactoylglutathione lyase family enzyme